MHCPFVINQNRYSIFDRTVEKNGLKKTTGILKKGLITFSPLAQGSLQTAILMAFRRTAEFVPMADF